MAYAERRKRNKGVRYRGMYKAAGGSYRSAGTFSTEERALEVAREAERHALIAGPAAVADSPSARSQFLESPSDTRVPPRSASSAEASRS